MLGYMKKGGKRKTDADEGNTLNNSLLDDEYSSQTELAENPVLDAVGFAESVSPSQPSHISKKQTTEFEAKRKKQWQKEGYRWDFCLVLPNPEDDSFKKEEFSDEYKAPNEIIERLHLAGLETHQFLSGDADEIFIKIRAPLKILREHAANVEYNLLMDSAYLKRHVENKNEPIGSDPAHTLLSPYECLYTKYDDSKRALFAKADGLRHPFSSVLRIKLIYDIITNDEDDCCSLNLRRLKVDGSGSIIAYFPLHDDGPREQLARNWFGWSVRPWEQPLDDVKEYVGEKITLYFAFTGHYTTWLTSLCAVSLVVILYFFVLLVMEGNLVMALSKGFMIPFFCIFVAIWAQLMLEYWKQTQNVKAMEWGQTEFEEEEDERPEFEQTKMVPSLISGQQSKYFSPVIRGERQMWSLFVVCCMVMMVLLVVSMIFYLQYLVNNDFTGTLLTLGNGLVSVLQAVSIVVLNTFYSNMAVDLNNNENHRTDTEYDDSLIGKLYVFQFVNS
ncbi:calcium-activated chloride channel-domain-containing protein [Ochromonadaceae sp. CCMP2298]|nr:calcium-activated chloride channel-domain-containing protein [Ochromonadaceae sp. CCMP2298]